MVSKTEMPKEMSDWIDENINMGNYEPVWDGMKKGYAMKSRDCTVVFFPNWNCDNQFKNIIKKF